MKRTQSIPDGSDFTVFLDTCGQLPAVTAAFRNSAREGPASVEAFKKCTADATALRCLETQDKVASSDLSGEVKVAFWNLERCKFVEQTAVRLTQAGADINLLCEMDLGMARSFQRHTTREIANHLGQNYAFGVEFVELGLGDAAEQARHAGEDNEHGLHGNAVLAKTHLGRPALVRLDDHGRWFFEPGHERRLGGRIAILASVAISGVDVTVVCTHFESNGDPATRALEMRKLLAAIDQYAAPGSPALIAGDLNTSSTARGNISNPETLAKLISEDPDRLVDPVHHEPLFDLAAEAGFEWRHCNATGATQRAHTEPRLERKLDWFLTRGLRARNAAITPAEDSYGTIVSDHDLLTVNIALEGRP